MTGLIRNNLYTALASAKWLAIALLVFGVVTIVLNNDRQTLLVVFSVLCPVVLSTNAIASLRKESASKWHKYKLIAPVTRREIIKSYFFSQLLWVLAGVLPAGAVIGLSVLFHGFPFGQNTDLLMVFVTGISASLLIGAIFYPLFYLGGEERNEAVLAISLLGAVGLLTGMVVLLNLLFGPKPALFEWLLGSALLLLVSLLLFLLSYQLTVMIFRRKEY